MFTPSWLEPASWIVTGALAALALRMAWTAWRMPGDGDPGVDECIWYR